MSNLKRLWLEAKGYPWQHHHEIAWGLLPKKCYLCGKEEDWLLGLRKLIPIYGKVKWHSFSDGSHNWIWWSTETCLSDIAKDEYDCIREICAKPGCWFSYDVELRNTTTGESVVIPSCSQRRIVRLLRNFVIDSAINGYAAMRFVGLSICWAANWLKMDLLNVVI